MDEKELIDLSHTCADVAITKGLAAAQSLAASKIDCRTISMIQDRATPCGRTRGLYLLYLLASEVAIAALRHALHNDDDEIVRHEAACFLGALRSDAVIEDLVSAIASDSSSLVRHEAAEALGEIPSPRALAALKLLTSSSDPMVSGTAKIALDGVLARLRVSV
jgi:hypothetical protein